MPLGRATDISSTIERLRRKGRARVRVSACGIVLSGPSNIDDCQTVSEMLDWQEYLYLVDPPAVQFDPTDYAASCDSRIIVDIPWLLNAVKAMIPLSLGGQNRFRCRSNVILAGHARLHGEGDEYAGMVVVEDVAEYRDLSNGFQITTAEAQRGWVKVWQARNDQRSHRSHEQLDALIKACRTP